MTELTSHKKCSNSLTLKIENNLAKSVQANKHQKLQEGKSLAKTSFEANRLKELTLFHGYKRIVISHPDVYNFTVTINNHTNYYGRFSNVLIKAFTYIHKKNASVRFQKFLKDSGYTKLKPNMSCSSLDILNIIKEINHES